jgi:hypothetical protein
MVEIFFVASSWWLRKLFSSRKCTCRIIFVPIRQNYSKGKDNAKMKLKKLYVCIIQRVSFLCTHCAFPFAAIFQDKRAREREGSLNLIKVMNITFSPKTTK